MSLAPSFYAENLGLYSVFKGFDSNSNRKYVKGSVIGVCIWNLGVKD